MFGEYCLPDQEEAQQSYSKNERDEDLGRTPWSRDTAPCQGNGAPCRPSYNKRIATGSISEHGEVQRGNCRTHVQSRRINFSENVPGGVGSLMKAAIERAATPHMGRLRSGQTLSGGGGWDIRDTHRIAISTALHPQDFRL